MKNKVPTQDYEPKEIVPGFRYHIRVYIDPTTGGSTSDYVFSVYKRP